MSQRLQRMWGWYFSRDEELYFGPYSSREEAAEAGANEDPDTAFYVAECHKGPLHTAIFCDLDERIDDANVESSQEDACPSEKITDGQWREMEIALNAVMVEWAARHNLTTWAFDQIRHKTRHEPVNR